MFEEFRLRISLLPARSTFLAPHSVEYRANSLVANLVVRLCDYYAVLIIIGRARTRGALRGDFQNASTMNSLQCYIEKTSDRGR
jgi:hypothetical protein